MKNLLSLIPLLCLAACSPTPTPTEKNSSNGAPYPYSKDISGIEWHIKTHKHLALGSDNWPTTWAEDDYIYTAWGDGGGFNGTNKKGRVSLGVARISGPMDNYHPENIWGGYEAPNSPSFKGKSYGILSIDGILYMALFSQENVEPYKVGQIAYSTDKGKSFKIGINFNESDAGFSVLTLLNFGKNYAGARDNYVYIYSGQPVGGCTVRCIGRDYFLARVDKNKILERDSYRFFAGFKNQNQVLWTQDINQRTPIFSDANGASVRFGVVYNPWIKKYLLSNSHDNDGGAGIFEADEPWGPWRTVAYYNNWLDFGYSPSYHIATPKWMGQEGSVITMVFSAKDRWNTVQGTLILN